MVAQLADGRYADRTILSPQSIAQLHTGQVATTGGSRYGLGWRESTLGDPDARIVWHAGATASSFAHLLLVPGSDLAVVVLANVYSLMMDGPLASAAFDVARIMRGGGPGAEAAEDPTFTRLLAGLVMVAVLLLGLLGWSVVRAVRWRRRPARPPRRTVAGAIGWVAGCAALGGAVIWAIPASWDGAGLTQVRLFAPDVADAIVAVAGLAGLLALVRVGAAGLVLAGRRAGR